MRAYQIDSLRLIAMLLVFSTHSLMIMHAGEEGLTFHSKYCCYGICGVSFFIILSGLLASYTYKPIDSKIQYIEYIKKRALRMFPMHWVCMLMFLPLSFVFYGTSKVLTSLLASTFLIQSFSPYTVMAVNGPAWTISVLMIYYMLTPALMKGINRLPKNLTLYIAVIALLLVMEDVWYEFLHTTFPKDPWYYHSGIHCQIFTYLIGLFLGCICKHFPINETLEKHASIIEIATVLVLVFLVLNFRQKYLFYHPAMVLFIYVFFQGKGILSRLLSNKALWHLSKISFAFYLTHFFFVHLTLYLSMFKWRNFQTLTLQQGFILTIAALFATFLTSFVLYELVEKRLTTYLSRKIINK